jgi:hypothetical protein
MFSSQNIPQTAYYNNKISDIVAVYALIFWERTREAYFKSIISFFSWIGLEEPRKISIGIAGNCPVFEPDTPEYESSILSLNYPSSFWHRMRVKRNMN